MKIVFGKGKIHGTISGADEILVANAIQLKRAGHQVSVLLMYPNATAEQFHSRLQTAGVTVTTLASEGIGNSLGASREITRRLFEMFPFSQRVIRRKGLKISTGIALRYYEQCSNYFAQEEADLVHVITPDSSAMVMIRAAHDVGVPVLYQEVGTPFHPPGYEESYQQFISVLPLCAEIAALSPQLARMCREQLPAAGKISVLPVLVDENFNRNATVNHRARPSELTFGFAARLEHLKGALALVDAFACLQPKDANMKLRIAGEGSLRSKIIGRAQAHNIAAQCELTGVYTQIEQKSDFMQSIDVFVLPSLTEGTPNAIIEAMAYGLPIISTTVGGVPDLVNWESGILVPPGDVAALTQAMERLANDPQLRAQMGRAARTQYEKLFSPDLVLPLMVDIYKRVAASRERPLPRRTPESNGLLHPWAHIDRE